jgi:hypothetical protein
VSAGKPKAGWPAGATSKPIEIEWFGEMSCRSMPKFMRSAALSPLARTISRAEIVSPVASVTVWCSSPVMIPAALPQTTVTPGGIAARTVLTSLS